MTIVRSLLTVILVLAFVGLWVWAWGKGRKPEFDAAAQLPLIDGESPAKGNDPC